MTDDMDWLPHIQAVLFDMDGTLLDSEFLTDIAVQRTLEAHGVSVDIDTSQFYGVTWREAARIVRRLAPQLEDVPLESQFQEYFHRGLIETVPPAIPGAPQAVMAASSRVGTALVSSSDRASVEYVVGRLGLAKSLRWLVCAEDVQRSKPDPQCYRLAADKLGVDCGQCLVFEDSIAGLAAARAAGMRTVAIRRDDQMADLCVDDFTELPHGFFACIGPPLP